MLPNGNSKTLLDIWTKPVDYQWQGRQGVLGS
jgi:hypothetical protein